MATIKSTSVTNLDAVPMVANEAGAGAPTCLQHIADYATVLGVNPIQTVALVRVPTTVMVKAVFFEAAAMSAGTLDVGVYYGNGPDTPAGSRGLVVSQALFASAVAVTSAVARTDITNESTNYPVNKRQQPLWQAAGLSTDPGGSFDIVATTVTTVTVGGLCQVEVAFAL